MLLENYPEALIAVVGALVLVIAVAIGFGLDVFLESAEREEPAPARPRNSSALTDAERDELMAAHRRVVARHADWVRERDRRVHVR